MKKRVRDKSPYIGRPALAPFQPYVAPPPPPTPPPPPPVKILVAIPAQDLVHTHFMADLIGLMQYTTARLPDVELGLQIVQATYLALSRQQLANEALAWEADTILWLDTDMRFPPNTLERLLDHAQHIVGATYLTRRAPHRLAGSQDPAVAQALQTGDPTLVPVDWLPFGCLLTDAAVFTTIPPPHFDLDRKASDGYVGEDAAFCHLAREHGLTVYCDPTLSLELKHTGSFEYALPAPQKPVEPPKPLILPSDSLTLH